MNLPRDKHEISEMPDAEAFCSLASGLCLVWVDVAARTLIAPEDLPIGVTTAAIGGGFFIGLMRKR
ncbi:iron chelate uptake ABC transporter family permease subunit [Pseudomonas canadensis]|uniref:iron chelate uptake ABC transporter family permease subunit n=1 Tax=Pseudomonas canadensis TaxID=915099 RepID=UPI00351A1EA0